MALGRVEVPMLGKLLVSAILISTSLAPALHGDKGLPWRIPAGPGEIISDEQL